MSHITSLPDITADDFRNYKRINEDTYTVIKAFYTVIAGEGYFHENTFHENLSATLRWETGVHPLYLSEWWYSGITTTLLMHE